MFERRALLMMVLLSTFGRSCSGMGRDRKLASHDFQFGRHDNREGILEVDGRLGDWLGGAERRRSHTCEWGSRWK